jgi:pilus biogenesis lipoprotein CpaD
MTTGKPGSATFAAGARFGRAGVIMLGLLSAGCGLTVPPGIEPVDYTAAPRDLIAVGSIAESHVVQLGGGGGYPGKAERDRLDAFVTAVAANRPESLRVALRGPASPGPLKAVANQLVADGVDPKHILLVDRRYGPAAPRGTIVVEIERAIAAVPNCPGWVDHVSAPEDNRTEPNFGCSDLSNFAAMVSDPHHLSKGASSIYQDGERAATSVANYRTDKVKNLPAINETFSVIPSAR